MSNIKGREKVEPFPLAQTYKYASDIAVLTEEHTLCVHKS